MKTKTLQSVMRLDRLRFLLGPLMLSGSILAFEIAAVVHFPIHPFFVATALGLLVVFSTFHGGIRSGYIASILALVYEVYAFGFAEHALRDRGDNLALLAAMVLAYPAVVTMVGLLQQRAETATRLEAERDATRAQAQALERLNKELKASEESRRTTEERLRALISSAPFVFFTIDTNSNITFAEGHGLATLGLEPEGILGQNVAKLFADEPDLLRQVDRVLKGLETYTLVELRQLGQCWETRWSALRGGDGEIAEFLGVSVNVTERKKLEEQRHEVEVLRQMDLLKDQFISILSHELRTPLNAITGFGSILDDEVAGPLTETQHHYLRKMLVGAKNLLILVNDLLDIGRIQAGQFSVSMGPTQFSAVLDQTLASLTALADQRQHRIVSEVSRDLPIIRADDQRIEQVLTNLLSNAIKFTPDGGTITIKALVVGNWLRVEVMDTGAGIAPEDIGKLFQRFTQLNMTATRKVGGAGLGLSISKAIIEAHGGAIGVLSEGVGKGSTFWFTLPVES